MGLTDRGRRGHYAYMRRYLGLLCLASLTGLGLGCEEESFTQVNGQLELPEFVDFGDVQVGMVVQAPLVFTNAGRAPVVVSGFEGSNLGGSRFEFKIPREGLSVFPGRSENALFSFQPFEASEETFEATVTVTLQGQEPRTVTLRGRGIRSGLEITPNPLDFGAVLAGSSRTLELTLTNRLSIPVTLRSAQFQGGLAVAQSSSGTGRFDLAAPTDAQGLLNGGQPLAPGASIVIPVTYSPDPTNLEASDRAQWAVSNCDFELCEVKVDLRGAGTTGTLACTPEAVDFGVVNPGRTRNMSVICTNAAADQVSVDNWRLEAGSATEYNIVTPVGPVSLGTGESVELQIAFSPTQQTWDTAAMPQGAILIDSSHSVGGRLDAVRVPLQGRAGGPTMVVSPMALHFGDVAVGTYNDKRVLIENRGYEALDVSMVLEDRDMTGAFAADLSSFTLAVGTSTVMTVRFAPQSTGPIASAVQIHSNDTLQPVFDLTVNGAGLTLPPCAYRTTPTRLSFGAVRFSETPVLSVTIENIGQDPCLINDLDIVPGTFGATTAYALVNGPQTGVMLAAGANLDVPVRYTPMTPGGDRADLGFYISSPTAPNPTVPLYGVGEPLVQVECPPPVTTQAGVPVTLTAMGLAVGANITGYTWALTSFPIGGQGTPNQWTPNPPRAITEQFLPFIVGTYDIQVTMTDDVGRMASCTTQVIAEGEGLQVTMTWDGSGDVDLHLHNDVTTNPWFGNDDCYYSNTTPTWNGAFPVATGPNPELDFDNTSANGPENTRILVPAVGQTYTVAAHNYSSAAGRLVTIDIYCGGTLPQATYVSRPLAGSGSGDCSTNDFWKVAQVTFTSQNTCTVVPINTYGPSSAACSSF